MFADLDVAGSRRKRSQADSRFCLASTALQFLQVDERLSAHGDFAEAVPAVDGFVAAGLKGDFRLFAALGACRGEHLALTPVPSAGILPTVALGPLCLTTGGTSPGFVGEASGVEKLLFPAGKGEGNPTIGTLDGLVLETQMTTPLCLAVRVLVIEYLEEIAEPPGTI